MHDFLCPAQSVGADFTKSDVFDEAFFLKVRHGLDSMFDWGFAVGSVTVVQVDAIDTKARERSEAGLADIRRVGTQLTGAVRVCHVGEFGGDEDVVPLASAFEPLTDELLTVLESTPNALIMREGAKLCCTCPCRCLRYPRKSGRARKLDPGL